MKRILIAGTAALALTSSFALAQPESLLPPIFDNPTPAPSASPRPRPSATAEPRPTARPAPAQTSSPVVQSIPGSGAAPTTPAPATTGPSFQLPANFPTLAELEAMEDDELDAALGLTPKFDIPLGARREMKQVGLLAQDEGGFRVGSFAYQPAALIRAAMEGTRRPLVSRWGHILLRRALASRLNAPEGMDPADFIAMRAALLNRMGEAEISRSLVQDVDSANYNLALTNAAFDAYLATGDVLGICPVAELQGLLRKDPEWELTQSICNAFSGNARASERELKRALGTELAPAIDVLLAQRFAGAAADGRRAVNIEWDGVEEMTPWRHSLARSLGVEVPDDLLKSGELRYAMSDALIPAVPLVRRVEVAPVAGGHGLLSSAAMVDLYSQLYASDQVADNQRGPAQDLRLAYAAPTIAARVSAMRKLWGADTNGTDYGNLVLTAYAAARLPVSADLADDAEAIIASMLSAGLDRNAMRWGSTVSEGSAAWGLLALAQPTRNQPVSSGAFDSYVSQDKSVDSRKSKFLLAGLAGLGRLETDTVSEYSSDLGVNLGRESPWSLRIDSAGQLGNGALVALLAGLGLQGNSWDQMTARHLFHIVRALNRAGLNAEARMIAAEAVARA